MSDFHSAMSPDDLDPRHQGEWIPDDLIVDEPEEGESDDTEK